jgi:hypothetical protein
LHAVHFLEQPPATHGYKLLPHLIDSRTAVHQDSMHVSWHSSGTRTIWQKQPLWLRMPSTLLSSHLPRMELSSFIICSEQCSFNSRTPAVGQDIAWQHFSWHASKKSLTHLQHAQRTSGCACVHAHVLGPII